jgi:hypothetical protein
LKDKTAVEKEKVKFDITLNKPDLLDELVWMKNGVELNLGDKDKYEVKAIGDQYSLIIKDLKLDDDAEYSVQVKGTNVVSKAKLTVEGWLLRFKWK